MTNVYRQSYNRVLNIPIPKTIIIIIHLISSNKY